MQLFGRKIRMITNIFCEILFDKENIIKMCYFVLYNRLIYEISKRNEVGDID